MAIKSLVRELNQISVYHLSCIWSSVTVTVLCSNLVLLRTKPSFHIHEFL